MRPLPGETHGKSAVGNKGYSIHYSGQGKYSEEYRHFDRSAVKQSAARLNGADGEIPGEGVDCANLSAA